MVRCLGLLLLIEHCRLLELVNSEAFFPEPRAKHKKSIFLPQGHCCFGCEGLKPLNIFPGRCPWLFSILAAKVVQSTEYVSFREGQFALPEYCCIPQGGRGRTNLKCWKFYHLAVECRRQWFSGGGDF